MRRMADLLVKLNLPTNYNLLTPKGKTQAIAAWGSPDHPGAEVLDAAAKIDILWTPSIRRTRLK